MSIQSGFGGPLGPLTPVPTFANVIPVTPENGYIVGSLDTVSARFDSGVSNLNAKMQAAMANATTNPSDPKAIADLQSALGDYTTYRGLQSSTIKAFKDTSMQIIQNI